MIWIVVLLFVTGMALSAFFSGTETGYYRATRARLTMDAVGGNLISRGLIWLANNPVMFVATALVGNNVANYLVSESIVRGTQELIGTDNFVINLMATILFAPVIFVYGELLPKDLFYQAPNRLLKAGGAVFLFCCILFLPVTAVLWVLGRLLSFLIGEAPEKLQASIARYELQRLLDESQDAGVLRPAQRELAQTMFNMANRSVETLSIPSARFTAVQLGTRSEEVFRISHRNRTPEILVTEKSSRKILGYVRVLDLYTDEAEVVDTYRPLIEVSKSEPSVSAMMRLRDQRESVARVVDDQGKTTGLVRLETLSSAAWGAAH